MSRGNKMFLTSAGLLFLAVAIMWANPAAARSVTGSVAAVDNVAPDPPASAEAFPGAGGVDVSWELSPSEGVRQTAVGRDFTSFGTFANTRDVTGYNVWYSESGADFVAIPGASGGPPTVGLGVSAYLDEGAVSGPSYVYRVTAWDGTNDSDPAETGPVSLGPPPVLIMATDDIDLGSVGPGGTSSETVTVANDADDAEALLFVRLEVEGDGFSVSDESITVAANASGTFDVSFDATGVGDLNGDYVGTLTVSTNDPDPDDRVVEIGLSATVAGGVDVASVSLSAESISFGQVLIDETSDRTLTITNEGGLDLEATLALAGDSEFTISTDMATVAAGGTADVTVTFSPIAEATSSATLTVSSNDPDNPSLDVSLSGSGVTEIVGPGVVQVTVQDVQMTFAMDLDLADQMAVDDFTAAFITALAAELGISEDRIINITLTAGSTIVDFQIIEDADPASTEPSAAAAVTALETAVTTDATVFSGLNLGDASGVAGVAMAVSIQPVDDNGDAILGWFTRGGTSVSLDDFFSFGDAFGSKVGEPSFDTLFDIAGDTASDPPDGSVGFGDFFRFADDFGKTVANAADVQALLGI